MHACAHTRAHTHTHALLQNTSLGLGCWQAQPVAAPPAPACQLPPYLQFSTEGHQQYAARGGSASCPLIMLTGFRAATQGLPESVLGFLTQPLEQPVMPGAVLSDPPFSAMHGCTCSGSGQPPRITPQGEGGGLSMDCTEGSKAPTKWITAVVLVAVLPPLAIGLAILVFVK